MLNCYCVRYNKFMWPLYLNKISGNRMLQQGDRLPGRVEFVAI